MARKKSAPEKKLFTAAEWKLVQSSHSPALGQLSESQLKRNIRLVREARDKWNDQATRQRRTKQQQQGSRVTDAAARSEDKGSILAEALARLEAQLAQGAAAGAGSAVTRTTKQQRTRGHRTQRAAVRATLSEHAEVATVRQPSDSESSADHQVATKKTAKKQAAKKQAVKKTAKKKGAKKKAAKKRVAKQPAQKKGAKPKTAKKKVAKKTARKATAQAAASEPASSATRTSTTSLVPKKTLASLAASVLKLDQRGQRQAQTRVKQARINQAGLPSRVRGHVSARGKRAQGRRDQRG